MYFLIENNPAFENQYQFRLVKKNQETVLTSESFNSKADCLRAVNAARRAGVDGSNYPLWDLVGNIRFNLFYGDNRLLIGSVRYKTTEERDQAVLEVTQNIAQAPVRDQASFMAQAA